MLGDGNRTENAKNFQKDFAWKSFRNLIKYYSQCLRFSDKAQFCLSVEQGSKRYVLPDGLSQKWLQYLGEKPIVHKLKFDIQSMPILADILSTKNNEEICVGYPLLGVYDKDSKLRQIIPLAIIPLERCSEYNNFTNYSKGYVHVKILFDRVMINQEWINRVIPPEEQPSLINNIFKVHDGDKFEGQLDFAASLNLIMSTAGKFDINPQKLSQHIPDKNPDDMSRYSVINSAIIFKIDSTIYVRALLKELNYIANAPAEILDTTALAYVFRTPTLQMFNMNNLKPIPFVRGNQEQMKAVENALNYPVSKLQGPPGTGKTQVSMNIISNCVYYGQSVLFCSKNHHAVDAIKARDADILKNKASLINFCFDDGRTSCWYDFPIEKTKYDLDSLYAPENNISADKVRCALSIEKEIEDKWENKEILCDKIYDLETSLVYEKEQYAEKLKEIGCSKDIGIEELQKAIQFFLDFNNSGFKGFYFRLHNQKAKYTNVCKYIKESCPKICDKESLVEVKEKILDIQRASDKIKEIEDRLRDVKIEYDNLHISEEDITRYNASVETIEKNMNNSLIYEWANRISTCYGNFDCISEIKEFCHSFEVNRFQITDSPDDYQLLEKHKNSIELFHKIEPAWATSLLSLYRASPLIPGCFDLAVIDEASQCDPVSVIPAMFRAKRVSVIGDPKQFSPIYGITSKKDDFLLKSFMQNKMCQNLAYTRNSAYSIVPHKNYIMLREHFRCNPDIADVFSDLFYEGRILNRTNMDSLLYPDVFATHSAIQWINVENSRDNEILQAVSIYNKIKNSGYKGSVGIISPFRDVVTKIQRQIYRQGRDRDEVIADVNTAYGFQGSQKDTIIYVLGYTSNLSKGQSWYLSSCENENIYNVAISRARACLVIVGDRKLCIESPIRCIKSLAECPKKRKRFDSYLEVQLFKALHERGIKVETQYIYKGYWFDFAYIDEKVKIDIEVDGKDYHFNADGTRIHRDIRRDMVVRAGGWKIIRLIGHDVNKDVSECVDRIESIIKQAHSS